MKYVRLSATPRLLQGQLFAGTKSGKRDSAERVSELPVIVSLEIHAGLEQQEIMVDIMKNVWSGLLVDEALSAIAPEERLPSPGELLRKILVKVKYVAPEPCEDGRPALQHVGSSSSTSVSEDDAVHPIGEGKNRTNIKVLDALSRLGVYTRSYHFSNLSQPGEY